MAMSGSSSSSSKPKPEDYATLHEDWLLRCRRASEDVENSKLDSTSSSQGRRAIASLLRAEQGRRRALQHALMEGSTCRTVANAPLCELLEQVRLESEEQTLSVSRPMILQTLDTLRPRIQDRPTLPKTAHDVDVDAFLEDFPEFLREEQAQQDSDSEDEEPPARQQAPPVTVDLTTASSSTEALPSLPRNPPTAVSRPNPYAKVQELPLVSNNNNFSYTPVDVMEPEQPHPPPSKPLPPPLSHSNNYPSITRSLQPLQAPRHHEPPKASASSWDDHRSAQNPFQTAREYARAHDDDNKAQQASAPAAPQQQHGPPPLVTGYNPYARPAAEANSPPPEQPTIRESLKRKFVPPKRAAPEAQKKQSNGRSDGGAPKGGGVSTRPPASNNNNNEDDSDDLPEELQRFGKDLVEKIENEIMDCGEPITFDDIAGLADAKQTVQEVVCWPMKRPDLFTGLRRAPNGLLLYGPPGTGKTLIGKAIAHESGATFFSISSSSLTSKWIGEGEKLVRTLFAVAAYRNPAVVFIDEIDSLLTQRKADENEASRRIKTEFLVQLDGTGTSGQGMTLTIGATNRPQELDEAARRRFVKRLYIPLPEEKDREILLRTLLAKNNHRLTDDDIEKLAKDTQGFSGADLKALSTDAAMGPIRQLGPRALEVNVQDVPPISYKHFRLALRGMHPSVSPSDLVQYEEWDQTYGSKRAEDQNDEGSDDDASN